MVDMVLMENNFFVVEHLGSPGFYLVLDFMDASPEFTKDMDCASKYGSYETANMVLKNLKNKGFTFDLKIQPLQVIYRVGV